MPLLALIWGLVSRVLPWLLSVASSITTALVASSAARALAIAAAITAFVLWMPMPAFLDALPGLVAGIPDGVVFAMSYARVGEGVAIVLGAMVIRFVARLVLRAIS